jgi:predicted ATPase/class 3 adenylate cyclase
MRADLPSGTVTFLFTDIEGSTRLLHALGPEVYGEALAQHRQLLRKAFTANGGLEVDTQGDAFLVAFPTATGAAAAARAGLEALAAGPIRVRVGLHTGAPTLAREGYVGVDLHRGARVAALAHGGQVVVSPTTAALLDGEPLIDLGLHRLKDFEGATRLYQLGDGSFPPLRTPGSVDLPTPATRFLGRERELFDAVSLVLERDPRVLTIVGPGGTGKTRFAIELARLLAEEADGGTVFVPLAPLRDPELVVAGVADRLGAAPATAAAVAARVGERRTHAVVDNVEHLLPAVTRPLSELVASAPALRLLATSREPLRIQGEYEFDLAPLVDHEAVAFFVERARAVRPELEPTNAVHELCQRLDRLPLALELAAARTKLLAPEALLERLAGRLDLLRGTRDADERHATLRATIAWSHDLLDEDESRLFRRLAVFRGGCTLDSAEEVCDANLDTLASLLDKSLVRRRIGRLGEERYWMLETIREFAAERLEESGEAAGLHRRHAQRMLAIAEASHISEDDDEPFDWPLALAEREDVRAALDWAAGADPFLALEVICAFEDFWGPHAPAEGIRRIEDLLARDIDIPPGLRARALRNLAGAAHQTREFHVADPAYEESLRLFTELDDRRGMASVRTRLAYRAAARGELEHARGLVEESQRDASGRFPLIEAQNAILHTHVALAEDRLDEAQTAVDRSAMHVAAINWGWWEALILTLRADIALRRGEPEDARRHTLAALEINLDEEHAAPTLLNTIIRAARVALAREDLELAGVLWGAASPHVVETIAMQTARWASELRSETRPEFVAAVSGGLELDLRDAAELALEDGAEGA